MATTHFNLPEIAAAQAQKHVTHNEALALADALLRGVVVSATTATAPGSPAEGEAYIVPSGGVFGSVAEGSIAIYSGGVWFDAGAPFGASVRVLDEGRSRVNAGSRGWVPGSVIGAEGGALGLRVLDYRVTLSGITTTVAAAIPTRSIVLGVTTAVSVNITGPAQIKIGDGSSLDRFGGQISANGGTNIGVVGPFAIYSDMDISVTAQDDATAATGGEVVLTALFLEPGDPAT